MNTEEVVIDDRIREELREVSKRKGRSLDESIERYIYFLTEGHKKIAGIKMSPALAGFAGIMGNVPDDYPWREVAEEERNKKSA